MATTPNREPSWKLFECPGGNRWSSVREDYSGQKCNFSGCHCGGIVRLVDTTGAREVAGAWFRNLTHE